ncbi:MAG: hypothetical protein CSA32_02095 [Desulfobulbus propionicus]|nr:MAG: hypothetical protein CSA32_02095 [Desulfobulbus propionicus]
MKALTSASVAFKLSGDFHINALQHEYLMYTIERNLDKAALKQYDLIIIGGGIYGITLAYVASQLGMNNLLIEGRDFGWSTTYNHLRTVHGGLRYLQSLDLVRFRESVSERQWFLKNFPGLVKPLPCLMPLYRNGPYRPSVFKIALLLNDVLSLSRNKGVMPEQELENGSVLSADNVVSLFPLVDKKGLKGGAVWYDGGMPSSQLLITGILEAACRMKTSALNYVEAESIVIENGQASGVRAKDQESGKHFTFQGARIINATGPRVRAFAAEFDDDDPSLFQYSIAWNVLFRRPALSPYSLAIKPKRPGSSMYFIHGFNGQIMGGTVHSPWEGPTDNPQPSDQEIAAYIDDLNLTVPGLRLRRREVQHIYSGLLPAREQGTAKLANRAVIKDHGACGGPKGIYSVSGVKFTTARLVAEQTLKKIFPDLGLKPALAAPAHSNASKAHPGIFAYDWQPDEQDDSWKEKLLKIITNQAVLHLDDLIIRRTTLGDNPDRAMAIAPQVAKLFSWDQEQQAREIKQLRQYFQNRCGVS